MIQSSLNRNIKYKRLYSNDTINLIKSRIKDAAEWFVNKYNEQTSKCDNILDAWDNIDSEDKCVKVEGETFYINSILDFSDSKCNKIEIEGITLREPKYYKKLRYDFVEEYTTVAQDNYGTWKKKHLYNKLGNALTDTYTKIVRYDGNLAGKVKTFLRHKYDEGKVIYINKTSTFTLQKYRAILNLTPDIKSQWRYLIQEFQLVQKQIFDRIITNETGLEDSDEFKEWLEANKQAAKERRKESQESGTYNGLGKEQGQITIGEVRETAYGGSSKVVRYVKDIEELGREQKLCVYWEKGTVPQEDRYALFRCFRKVKFIELNKTEIKYVENLKNWMNMTEFKNSKAFARLATVLEIGKLEDLVPDNEEIIYETFPKYRELKERLFTYMEANTPEKDKYFINGNTLGDCKAIILNFAKENNLYDMSIWHEVVEFKQLMKDFGFLNYLNVDTFDNLGDDEQKIVKNMVYIILKNKKISCKFVEDYELVDKVPVEVYEQMEEQFETA